MKVLLQKNVQNVGKIGDVVEVKAGYARNYLLPQGLAVEPTEGNLRRVEAEKKACLVELASQKAEIEARAKLVDGKEVTITARANPEGHLYGSVGPAQIVAALAKENLPVEQANVVLDEPIRTLDKYEVKLHFGEGVEAAINVWVVPAHVDEGPIDASGDSPEGPMDVSQAEGPADEADSRS